MHQSNVIFAEIAHPQKTHGAENFGAQEMLKRVPAVGFTIDSLDPPRRKKHLQNFNFFGPHLTQEKNKMGIWSVGLHLSAASDKPTFL